MADVLIKRLYDDYLLVLHNMCQINEIMPFVIQNIETVEGKLKSDLKNLYQQRKSLRIELKSKLLKQKDYQMQVGQINKQIYELKLSFSDFKDKIINNLVRSLFGEPKDNILRNYFYCLLEDNVNGKIK